MNFSKKLLSYLVPQTLEKTSSKFNGEIIVRMSAGRVSIDAGGLMQSGKFLEETWSKALQKYKIQNTKYEIQNILVLGLGGGSIVTVLRKKFPHAKIVGVDIDPEMVRLGKKYLAPDAVKNCTVVIANAKDFVSKQDKKKKFDIIFVDLYKGKHIPKEFQTSSFLQKLDHILSPSGSAIFNLLAIQTENLEAKSFLDKVEKFFHDVTSIKVFANCLVIASQQK